MGTVQRPKTQVTCMVNLIEQSLLRMVPKIALTVQNHNSEPQTPFTVDLDPNTRVATVPREHPADIIPPLSEKTINTNMMWVSL